jgi:UDP-N-acetylglucosamine--N-acetylmuramyl-(pentapeptide) pyrophosphoryl-undecaprenol N-acetylglucosamine transferase
MGILDVALAAEVLRASRQLGLRTPLAHNAAPMRRTRTGATIAEICGGRVGPRVLIAAGGSGGHVFSGLALARTLTARDPTTVVRFAGTSRGIESRAVPAAGFPLDLLPVLPLFRRPAPETVGAPFAAVRGVSAAERLIRRHRVDVICGMGAYVTLPVAVGAWRAGVPVVLHEQNAVPGIANRLAARVAGTVALGVAEAAAAFPVPRERTVVVGNPVRPELVGLDRAALRDQGLAAFGLDPGRRTLVVFGGSHGARGINEALVAATPHWPQPTAMQILHACGRGVDHDAVRAAWAAANPAGRGLGVQVVPFIDRMDLAYAAADLALTRAGASTLAELTVAGVPAVIVPLARATAGHQAANARVVAATGGAVVVEDDGGLTGPRLAATAAPLLTDPERLAAMAEAMRSLGRPDAALKLAALVVAARRMARRKVLDLGPVPADRNPVS